MIINNLFSSLLSVVVLIVKSSVGLGNIARQYSFYMPLHSQPDLHTKAKKDLQHNKNLQEGGSENQTNEIIEQNEDITHILKKKSTNS